MAFTTLAHLIDVPMLEYAFERLNPRSSTGVDGVTWREYKKQLIDNLEDLYARLRNRTYEPQPVRRTQIPKGKGQYRPLGIPALEDKIVSKAVQLILERIYEQDFSDASHGYRPGRSCHTALRTLRHQMLALGISHVLDCDLSKFFDSLSHKKLLEILKKRIKDASILHLIKLWLKAGIMDGRDLVFPTQGSPQGSVISPLLANVYLHEVLDEWLTTVVVAHCYGRIVFVRYADDFIIGCTHPGDVPRIQKALRNRFAKYGLSINSDKTTVVPFARPRRPSGGSPPTGRPGTFAFLGFVHYWGKTRRGGYTIKRKMLGNRIVRCRKSIWDWCRKHRHLPVEQQHPHLCAKLRGMFQYYGLPCNWGCLALIRDSAARTWGYWLNRRGGRRQTWAQMTALLARYPLPAVSITQPSV
jgi:group II intron reverse transcriptase/maturase